MREHQTASDHSALVLEGATDGYPHHDATSPIRHPPKGQLMARDHARISVEIWNDRDFRKLASEEQHLYLMLVSSPKLSYCGVIDYVPTRFKNLARGLTAAKFRARVAVLAEHRFVLLDEDTAEVLVRSYVRHDGILKQPNVTKAMARALRQVVSLDLRHAVIQELARARREQPSAGGWKGLADKFPELLAEIDERASLNPSANPSLNPSVNPSVNPSGRGVANA